MSQYYFTEENKGHQILYGLDMPTGGYFFYELDINDELYADVTGLTLSQLEHELLYLYSKKLSDSEFNQLRRDFEIASPPTPLQRIVSKLFRKDLDKLLSLVKADYNIYDC